MWNITVDTCNINILISVILYRYNSVTGETRRSRKRSREKVRRSERKKGGERQKINKEKMKR